MDGPRRRARRYFAPVLTDVGLYDVWKTVQRVLTRAASLEGAMDAMLWYGSGMFATEAEVVGRLRTSASITSVPIRHRAAVFSLGCFTASASTGRGRISRKAQLCLLVNWDLKNFDGVLNEKVKPSTRQ